MSMMSGYDRNCSCGNHAKAVLMWYLPRGQPLDSDNYFGPHSIPDTFQDTIYESWVKDGDTPSGFRGGYPVYACDAHSFEEAFAARDKEFRRRGS